MAQSDDAEVIGANADVSRENGGVLLIVNSIGVTDEASVGETTIGTEPAECAMRKS